jgi:hypothetical protein
MRVVLKTPVSLLSRDGNGAGAPEKEPFECFCREKADAQVVTAPSPSRLSMWYFAAPAATECSTFSFPRVDRGPYVVHPCPSVGATPGESGLYQRRQIPRSWCPSDLAGARPMFNCLSTETDVEKPISHRWTQINTDGFIRVVLKTPVSILSRDGNGAGAPEKNLRMLLPRESGCPGCNRSVTVAAQYVVFAATQILQPPRQRSVQRFHSPGGPQAICG